MKRLLYALLILGFTNILSAQQWVNCTNGDQITSLLEADQDLWVGTTGGLVYYPEGSDTPQFFNRGNSGLPANWVTDVDKSADGRIWVATRKGLAIFDGINWLRHDSIQGAQLAVMNNGEMAIGTTTKLYQSSGNNLSVSEYESCNFEVTDMSVNPVNGDIWLTGYTFGCISVSRFDGTNWELYNYNNSTLPFESPGDNSLVVDPEGTLWVGTWSGLHRFMNNEWEQVDLSSILTGASTIYSVSLASNGDIWAVANTQELGSTDYSISLIRYDGLAWASFPVSNDLVQLYGSSVFLPGTQQFYLGTQGKGLFLTDLENYMSINTSNSPLPANRTERVLQRDDEMWLSTNNWTLEGNATIRINGENWTVFNQATGPFDPGNLISLESVAPDGRVWVRSDQYQYFTFEDDSWTAINFSALNAPDLEGIVRVAYDRNGKLWIFGNTGIARYDGSSWTTFSAAETGIINGSYLDVAFNPNNNDLWIGKYYGVTHFDGVQWRTYNFPVIGNNGQPAIYALAFGANGEVLAGGQQGLYVKNGNIFTTVPDFDQEQFPYGILSLFVDDTDNLWAGSLDALIRYQDGIQQIYNLQNSGLPDGGIYDINQDANGNIWLATESGLGLFNENGVSWVNQHTATDNFLPSLKLLVSPNPISKRDTLKVQLPENINGTLQARLLDMQGRQLWATNLTKVNANFSVDLGSLNLTSGVYILQVSTETGMGVMKVVVE